MSMWASIALYIAVFGVSAIIVQYGYKHKSRFIQLLGLLLPIIFAALRYNVGLDYMSYLNAYADIINPLSTYRYEATPDLEPTFYIITWLSDFLFSSPIALYFVYAAITVFAFYQALRVMQPKRVGVALFFFYCIFFTNSFNIMRQGAAISIGTLAIVHFINDNKRKAVAYTLIASLFHISALLIFGYMLTAHFMQKHYVKKRNIKKFFRVFMKVMAVSLAIAIAGLTISAVANFIYNATGRTGTFGNNLSLGVVFKYILTAMCLYIAVLAWRRLTSPQKYLALFVSLGLTVYALGIIHNEAARVGAYLIVLSPILFAVSYDNLRIKTIRSRLVFGGGIALLMIPYIISVHLASGEGVQYDYRSVISSEEYSQQVKNLGIQ